MKSCRERHEGHHQWLYSFIGGEAARQAIRSPEITSIVVLSRRKLEDPEALKSAKVKTVIVRTFLNYPDDVMQEIQRAGAAIWRVRLISKSIFTCLLTAHRTLSSINVFNEAYSTEVHHGCSQGLCHKDCTRSFRAKSFALSNLADMTSRKTRIERCGCCPS